MNTYRVFLPIVLRPAYVETPLWADAFDEELTYWASAGEGNWATTVTFFDDPYYDKAALLIPGDGLHEHVYIVHTELESLPSHWIGLQLEFYICDDNFFAFMPVLDILKDPNCYPLMVRYRHAAGKLEVRSDGLWTTIATPGQLAHGWHTLRLVADTTDMTYCYVRLDGMSVDLSGYPLEVEPNMPWIGYCPRLFVYNGKAGTTTSIAIDHVMVFRIDP